MTFEPERIQQTIEALAAPGDAARESARADLREMGDAAFPALVAGLQHADSTIRGACADLLGESGDDRAREPLHEVLRVDNSRWVRSRARLALAALGESVDSADDDAPKVRQRVNIAPPPPEDALRRTRRLYGGDAGSADDQPPPKSPDDMTADEIQALLDQLDVRLINGEITEATHQRLSARWQVRLDSMR
jgi:hypothetical protein